MDGHHICTKAISVRLGQALRASWQNANGRMHNVAKTGGEIQQDQVPKKAMNNAFVYRNLMFAGIALQLSVLAVTKFDF